VEFSRPKPNVWKGGGNSIAVTATRGMAYDGPIRVRLQGLPPGLHLLITISPVNFHSPDVVADADVRKLSMNLDAQVDRGGWRFRAAMYRGELGGRAQASRTWANDAEKPKNHKWSSSRATRYG